jgi:hypothetical protein
MLNKPVNFEKTISEEIDKTFSLSYRCNIQINTTFRYTFQIQIAFQHSDDIATLRTTMSQPYFFQKSAPGNLIGTYRRGGGTPLASVVLVVAEVDENFVLQLGLSDPLLRLLGNPVRVLSALFYIIRWRCSYDGRREKPWHFYYLV